MRDTERDAIHALLGQVFKRQIDNSEFVDQAARILGTKVGEEYPKFVWKADHYLTDADLCEKDPAYEKMMREDILLGFEAYFSS